MDIRGLSSKSREIEDGVLSGVCVSVVMAVGRALSLPCVFAGHRSGRRDT